MTPSPLPLPLADLERMLAEAPGKIALDVCELPDRTSPDDWPDAMLVTADELVGIVEDHLEAARKAASQVIERARVAATLAEALAEAATLMPVLHDMQAALGKPATQPDAEALAYKIDAALSAALSAGLLTRESDR